MKRLLIVYFILSVLNLFSETRKLTDWEKMNFRIEIFDLKERVKSFERSSFVVKNNNLNNKDLTEYDKYLFDDEGHILERTYETVLAEPQERKKCIYIYNKEKQPTNVKTFTSGGNLFSYTEIYYDETGKLLSEKTYNPQDEVVESSEYEIDSGSNYIRKINSRIDESNYFFIEEEESYFDPSAPNIPVKIKSKLQEAWTTFILEYNAAKQKTQCTEYENNAEISREVTIYDDYGIPIETRMFMEDRLISVGKYSLNRKNQKIKFSIFKDGEIYIENQYTYDARGNQTKWLEYHYRAGVKELTLITICHYVYFK